MPADTGQIAARSGDDGRQGHGYGRIGEPRGAGTTWKKSTTYPYEEADPEIEGDAEEPEAVLRQFIRMTGVDQGSVPPPFGHNRQRSDRGSFAHSSGRGLGESKSGDMWDTATDGISPLPKLSRTNGPPIGGNTWRMITLAPRRKTGSKMGYASPPPPTLEPDTGVRAWTLADLPDEWERELAKVQYAHRQLLGRFGEIGADDQKDGTAMVEPELTTGDGYLPPGRRRVPEGRVRE